MQSMKLARHQRFAIVMLLYVSTLFSALTLGFHQSLTAGQHGGAVDGVYCGSGKVIPGLYSSDIQLADPVAEFEPNCPLCGSPGYSSTLSSPNWSLDYLPASPAAPPITYSWAGLTPRFSWPALNPRASPAALLATALFS